MWHLHLQYKRMNHSGKPNRIATQKIVDQKSRGVLLHLGCATVTDATDDESLIDVQQIHILTDVDTVVPNIADPVTWPLIWNSKIIEHIITGGPLQTHFDNYPRNDTGRPFS